MTETALKPIAVIGLILFMLVSLIAVVVHRIKRDMGFGYRFIQVLAFVEGLPMVALLAILGILSGEATAGLIGSIVGALLRSKLKKSETYRNLPPATVVHSGH
jgi:hypothetical protein